MSQDSPKVNLTPLDFGQVDDRFEKIAVVKLLLPFVLDPSDGPVSESIHHVVTVDNDLEVSGIAMRQDHGHPDGFELSSLVGLIVALV